MSDQEMWTLTPEGREAARKVLEEYALGYNIEEIAEIHNLTPISIRILMLVDDAGGQVVI